jgi:signal transduction histidine kinase
MTAHLVWVLIVSAWAWRRDVAAARARHEVRGPLAVARLVLDGLERSARVDAIELELRRAALALDDLSGFRRGDPVTMVDLGRLVADAVPAWSALAEARGAALVVEPESLFVAVEPLRLAQACANLVANAIEHGGGYVHVRTCAAGGHARIEVRDDGPGLPAPLTALVTAARGRRSHRGHGLAIAVAIARSHGGRLISIPSTTGAHLALELPMAPARRSWSSALTRRPPAPVPPDPGS